MGEACSTGGEMRSANKIVFGEPDGNNHSEHVGVNRRIILKLILTEWGWGALLE
jgi:hypothetical protein